MQPVKLSKAWAMHPALLACTIAAALSACGKSQNSQTKEAWNEANDPEVMMLEGNVLETEFAQLPLRGQAAKMPWSDDYYPTFHGGITYRWNAPSAGALEQAEASSSDQEFAGQKDANPALQKVRSEALGYSTYSKEDLLKLTEAERTKLIETLSPAEKYDIYRGRFDYPTVASERARTHIFATLQGKPEYNDKFKIATWEGICHAWAPATILFKEPGPVTLQSRDHLTVPFGGSDVKALLAHMLDETPGQARIHTFVAERCNNDLSKDTIDRVAGMLSGLQAGNRQSLEDQLDKLNAEEMIDAAAKMRVATYMLAYAPSQEVADSLAQFEIRALSSQGSAMKVRAAAQDGAKNYATVGSAGFAALSPDAAKEAVRASINAPECADTNAGTFHLVISNLMGLRVQSFGIDVTRDLQVWNQAAAAYSSEVLAEMTGDQIAKGVAPGTVKELKIRTKLRYTQEIAMQTERSGNDVDLQSYHPLTGDSIVLPDGRHTKAYEYLLELDSFGRIIGGSWLTDARPDFLWGTGNFSFGDRYTDIEDIYAQAHQ